MDDLFNKLRAYGADVDGAMERFMDDEALYTDCLSVFAQDPAFDELQAAIKNADYEASFNAAHTLKGVSANMGLTPMTEALSDLVKKLRAHQTENLAPLCGKVADELERVRAL